MATYVNDLRLKEIGTGESSGTWGTETNVNLELIGEALSFGTEGITTNADTHTSTVADGSTDPARSMYIKYTGTLDSACTITIAPNTLSRLHFIENGTSGSQNIIISQGSGANVTIPPGDVKVVYLDGAGSGAAVVDAFASLSVVDLKVQDDLTVTDDLIVNGDIDLEGSIDVNGTANLDVVDVDGLLTASAAIEINGAAGSAISEGLLIDWSTNLARFLTYDSSSGSEIAFFTQPNGGSSTERVRIKEDGGLVVTPAAGGHAVFNEGSIDADFRVESNGNANMLLVDGGNDHVNIGTSTDHGAVLNVQTTDNTVNLALVSTDTDGDAGPHLDLTRDAGNVPSDGDVMGTIRFRNDNTDLVMHNYASIETRTVDVSAGTEDGRLEIATVVAGTEGTSRALFDAAETVFNDNSVDLDFRVESNGNANMIFVDGGNDHVGIGTATPDANSFGAGHGVLGVASATGSAKTAMVNLIGDGNDTADTRVGAVFFNDASATGAGATIAGVEANRATDHATDPGGTLIFNTNNSGGSYGTKATIRANGTVSFSTDGSFLTNTKYNYRDAVGIENPNSSSYSVATSSVLTAGSMSTGRSINATGTINASGADYAEYMYKADGCGTIAKGDVVGVDINGKLTDVFADAISFVIKSTNPSYVGGDTWADEEPPNKDEEDTTEWDSWYARTEGKRATVDRIAFSGQVPVNITGSFNAGDYVYPEVNGSGIKAVAKSSPTFDEYKLCVGKIWATEKDGRPFVAVKIG